MNEELTMTGHQPPKRRGATKLVVAAGVAAVVSLGAIAFAAIPDAGTGVFHGCYDKTSGALRLIDPSLGQSCGANENAVTWNQRGVNWKGTWSPTTTYNINDAVASRGTSYIAIAPNLNSQPPAAAWNVLASKGGPGPRGPANAFTAYVTGPANVPLAYTSLAHLNLPAGRYVVFGKAFFTNISPGNGESTINCQLQAGANTDEAEVQLQPPNNPTETEGIVALNVGTTLSAAGGVDLNCEDGGPGSGTGLTQAQFISVSAIQVATLTQH
jgi:hypothetical protein